jgi:hypothetical protein
MGPKIKLPILAFELVSIVGLMAFNFKLSIPETRPKVLAEETAQPTNSPIPTPKVLQRVETIAEPEAPASAQTTKESYVIAFIGDSMVETMGAALPYVYRELRIKYPKLGFSLYNYGIGGENLVEATSRFGLPYSYKDSSHEPLPELGADIIIVGSYSYNPITPFDKNEAWLLLSDLVNKAKEKTGKVYILAEQAPLKEGFGEGPGGVNWPAEITDEHIQKIISGLENAVGLAETLNVGLINVFEQSRIEGSEYGNPEYVAVHDGIHYSEEGRKNNCRNT